MKEIIQKNGKYWKECDIVILPTKGRKLNFKCDCKDEEFHHYHCGLVYDRNNLFLNGDLINLHILTNEQINEGDYYYDKEDKLIFRCKDNQEAKARNDYRTIYNEDRWFLVIATTDRSLTIGMTEGNVYYIFLPQLPESFIQAYIKAYNEDNPITEVLVEYEYICSNGHTMAFQSLCSYPYCNQYNKLKLKLRSDNTIIISTSKTYTSQELAEAIKTFELLIINKGYSVNDIPKWIEENL